MSRFGIEFAPEVVQADGCVKNLAWRIYNAKKVLVSLKNRFLVEVVCILIVPRRLTACLQAKIETLRMAIDKPCF
jgi:hypothetical protein